MNVLSVLEPDAIPSIDDPSFGPDYFGTPDDEVVVVEGDVPRAYPIRILSYHEFVNDTHEDGPIAVTWCPICWSAVVYDRTVGDRTLSFGVSGKLADDTLVMYDRETDSEWKQSSGECLAGAFEGERLTARAAPILTYEEFRSNYPTGAVLQPVKGSGGTDASLRALYDMTPYDAYADGETFGLYGMRGIGEQRSWDRADLDPKTLVLGIEHDGEAMGYPVPSVEAAGAVVTDTVGGQDIVVFLAHDSLYAFENPGYEFAAADDGFCADDTTWDGATGRSNDGRQLTRVPARRLFAFTWQDDHGSDTFY